MSIFRRLLALTAGQRRWIAVGALLGFLAVASNVALMAVSAFLISKAALISNVAEVALAITAVRVLAIGRAAFRYFERTVTHRATFAILADLRVWFFAAIEPLAPARLATRRSGDLLTRIVGDIETLEDFYVRVVLPPIVAGLVTLFVAFGLGLLDVTLGLTLAAFLVASGIVLPLVARRLSRAPGATLIARRGQFGATLVDEINGLADLVALDRAAAHRDRVLALGTELDAAGERLAIVRSATSATSSTLAGLAGVTVLAIGVGLVGTGRLDPVFLAAIPLVALASFEVIGPLAQAFGSWETNKAAAQRLFELTDAQPEVADRPPATRAVTASVPPAPRASRSAASASATARTSRTSSTASTCPSRRAPASPSSGRAARASRPSSTSCSVSGSTTRARSGSAGARSATSEPRTSGGCSAWSPRTSTCSTRRSATTSRSPMPMSRTSRSKRRVAGPGPRVHRDAPAGL